MHTFKTLSLFMVTCLHAGAADVSVSGKVLNNIETPLPDAIVELVNLGIKDTTGTDGAYSFEINTGVHTIQSTPVIDRISIHRGVLTLRQYSFRL